MSNKAGKGGLVPRLRFPEFREAGEWDHSPLSKYVSSLDAGVSVVSGDRPAKNNEVGILKTSAVTEGVLNPVENKIVLDKDELQRVKESVSKNSIIISRMNTPALVGANAYVAQSLDNIFLPDRLWAAKPRRNTSMRFIALILGSEKGRAALSKLATGTSGSMKNITKPAVLELEIAAPSFTEQQKIADCLASLDELITLEAQKLNTLKTHKKGLMQQLFPAEGETLPKLRFPKFRDAGGWEQRELGPLTTKVGSGITPTGGDKNYNTEGRTFVRSQNVGWGELILNDVAFIDEGTHQSFAGTEIQLSDVLLNITGASIGRSAVADARIAGGNVNQHVCIIRVRQGELHPVLLNQFLISEHGQKQIDSFQAGGNRQGLNFAQIRSFSIPLPPTENEQCRIADCLVSLDDLISAQAQKLAALKTHKKGLMQQLFPVLDEAPA
ncbi:MAG TPA: restriction endonuclease subunit S [Lentisphaeria bacterium]|nr:restriction endonuclease subunit S [Lentisphaeria bacterium]